MAKLNRERKLVERRVAKQAKKLARKEASAQRSSSADDGLTTDDQVVKPDNA